jgi:hypothetical protein
MKLSVLLFWVVTTCGLADGVLHYASEDVGDTFLRNAAIDRSIDKRQVMHLFFLKLSLLLSYRLDMLEYKQFTVP